LFKVIRVNQSEDAYSVNVRTSREK